MAQCLTYHCEMLRRGRGKGSGETKKAGERNDDDYGTARRTRTPMCVMDRWTASATIIQASETVHVATNYT